MPRPHLLLALLLLPVVCGVASLRADPLADLDSPDYAVRTAATEAMLRDDALTPQQVGAWLRGDLSLEQRHRLIAVAKHVVLRDFAAALKPADVAPRLALGFELFPTTVPDPDGRIAPDDEAPAMAGRLAVVPPLDAELNVRMRLADGREPMFVPPGGEGAVAGGVVSGGAVSGGVRMTHAVLVVTTLPGLPAHGRLRAGDLIVALNGKPVHPQLAQVRFADLIAAFPAGQPVTLGVLRDGEAVNVVVPPATFGVLEQLYDSQPSRLCDAAAERWRRFLASVEGASE